MPFKNPSPKKHPYRVAPDSKIKLNKVDTSDASLFPDGKTHGNHLLPVLASEIGELQDCVRSG